MTPPRPIAEAASTTGPKIAFVVCIGPAGGGETERLVSQAEKATALDLLDRAVAAGVFAPVLLATPEPDLFLGSLPPGVLTIESPRSERFHFGHYLRDLCAAEGFIRVLACGAGAGVLTTSTDLRLIAGPLQKEHPAVVANNLYSADLVGVTPSTVLRESEDLPADDNGVGFYLWRNQKIPGYEPTRTAATQFDIDDPTDIAVAALHPGIGPRLRDWIKGSRIDFGRLEEAARVFRDPRATAVFAGRMGSATWSFFERETACRARVFSEERGMKSLGLEGQARSLVALHLAAVGPTTFMEHLAEVGDAVFIDTRVLIAHERSSATREDRFLSDLGRWELISDEFLREFTRAATRAPVPVILGGHSLVAGGLMALVEAAWSASDTHGTTSQTESQC